MSQFYLSIKGVRQGQFKGTPNLRNSNDWMTGTRFSMQVDVPYDSSTGHPTGRRRYVPLIISKEWGAASLQILQALATSETLNPVILEFIHTGAEGDESVWQRITLTNASILDVRRYADFGAREIEQGPHEMEDISFVFQKIAVDDLIGSTVGAKLISGGTYRCRAAGPVCRRRGAAKEDLRRRAVDQPFHGPNLRRPNPLLGRRLVRDDIVDVAVLRA